MKRSHNYEINHNTNTVVVTKKLHDAASQMGSDEYRLFEQFKKLGLSIEIEARIAAKPRKAKKSNSPLRSLKGNNAVKTPLIKYEKMALFISLLDDADIMMDEFDDVRRLALTQEHPRKYVNEWFRRTFPRFEELPEFNDEGCAVHNPNPIEELKKVS